ncbi:hypothetical protein [Pedobacter sp. UYP1]|uniref:hypothetical protein n=1 Tax=Pedobacter sp. UYP1 TaxID=1756396 RepID=UPI00339A79F9
MMDYDFLSINLPYGFQKTSKNEWAPFNRQHLPLGSFSFALNGKEWACMIYKGLTDAFIDEIAFSIKHDESGGIIKFYLYSDESDLQLSVKAYNDYFNKLKLLGKLKLIIGK